MGYYNPIYRFGAERFAAAAREAGADGTIIVDLPPEEDAELRPAATKAGLAMIRLVAPTTDDARLQVVLKDASGFVYYVAVLGPTGTKSAAASDVAVAVARIRKHTSLPVAVGFGIKTPEQAAEIARGADAAVVGTALVQAIEKAGQAGAPSTSCGRSASRCAARGLPPPRKPDRKGAMNWLTNFVRPKIRALVRKAEVPENLWDKCPSCAKMIFHRDLEANARVCPHCGHHMRSAGAAPPGDAVRRSFVRAHRTAEDAGRSAALSRPEALRRPPEGAARERPASRTRSWLRMAASPACRWSLPSSISISWAARWASPWARRCSRLRNSRCCSRQH